MKRTGGSRSGSTFERLRSSSSIVQTDSNPEKCAAALAGVHYRAAGGPSAANSWSEIAWRSAPAVPAATKYPGYGDQAQPRSHLICAKAMAVSRAPPAPSRAPASQRPHRRGRLSPYPAPIGAQSRAAAILHSPQQCGRCQAPAWRLGSRFTIEKQQWMVTRGLEVTVLGALFQFDVNRHLGAVHIKHSSPR